MAWTADDGTKVFDVDEPVTAQQAKAGEREQTLVFEFDQVETPAAALPPPGPVTRRRHRSASAALGRALGALLALLVLIWLIEAAPWTETVSADIKLAWSITAVLCLATLSLFMISEWRERKQLIKLEKLRSIWERTTDDADARWEYAAAARRHYAANPSMQPFLTRLETKLRAEIPDSGPELAGWLQREALAGEDQQARRMIIAYSLQSGLLVGLSLHAKLELPLVLWRSLRMVLDVADVYGVGGGLFTRTTIVRGVLTNMAFASVSQYIASCGTAHAGVAPVRFLSKYLGQEQLAEQALEGLGVAFITARMGLSAMALCRPLPFNERQYGQALKDCLDTIGKGFRQRKDILTQEAPAPAGSATRDNCPPAA